MVPGTKSKLTSKLPQFDLYNLKIYIKVIFDKFNGKIMLDLWRLDLYICI